MSRKSTPRVFDVPLFGGEVVLCRSRDEWAYAMRHYKVEDDVSGHAGRCIQLCDKDTNERSYLIGVFNGSVSTLVHELAHAVFFILGVHGVETEQGRTNETFCYLLGHLTRAALPVFDTSTRKRA